MLLLLHSFLASDTSLFIASYLLANKHAEIYLTFRKHCRLLVLYYCLFSCLVVSNSLHPLDCSTPGFPVFHHLLKLAQTHVHWIDDAIQPSHPFISFSSCLPCFPASGSFPMSQLFASGGQSIGASTSGLVLPMNIQG